MTQRKKTKTKAKFGKHGGPQNAGVHNLPKNYADTRKDVKHTMQNILPIKEHGTVNTQAYKGLWDEESLEREVNAYFEYSFENDIKVAKAGVRLWLGISRSQYHEWETGNHGYKSDILEAAASAIELSYIGRSESFPTANIFLLKSSHGHSDKTEIEFTGDNVDATSIKEQIAKMGLNKEV